MIKNNKSMINISIANISTCSSFKPPSFVVICIFVALASKLQY